MANEPKRVLSPSAKEDVIAALMPLVELLERPEQPARRRKPGEPFPMVGHGPDILKIRDNALAVMDNAGEYVGYDVDRYTINQVITGMRELEPFTTPETKRILAQRIRYLIENAHNCPGGYHQVSHFDWQRNTNPIVWLVWIVEAVIRVLASIFRRELLVRAIIILGVSALAIYIAFGVFKKLETAPRLTISIAIGALAVTCLNAIWPAKR
jgi:hypothetical protein